MRARPPTVSASPSRRAKSAVRGNHVVSRSAGVLPADVTVERVGLDAQVTVDAGEHADAADLSLLELGLEGLEAERAAQEGLDQDVGILRATRFQHQFAVAGGH